MTREEAIESFKHSNEQAKLRLEVEKMRMEIVEIKELEFYIERDEMAIRALENLDTFMKYAYSYGKQDALSQEPCTDAVSEKEQKPCKHCDEDGFCLTQNLCVSQRTICNKYYAEQEPCGECRNKRTSFCGNCKKYDEFEPCDWYDVPSDEMTLEQARQAVKDLRKKLTEYLEQEPSNTVSREVFEQVMRERDIAIEQLHELGYELGQKIESYEVEATKLQQAYNKGFEDCRQAVFDLVNADWKYEGLETDVASLSPVTQKPETVTEFADRCRECGARYGKLLKQKTGHWIGHREHCENLGVMPSGLGAYEWCSNCDCGIDVREWHRNNYNYCPNCGAKMTESEG